MEDDAITGVQSEAAKHRAGGGRESAAAKRALDHIQGTVTWCQNVPKVFLLVATVASLGLRHRHNTCVCGACRTCTSCGARS